MPAYKIDFLFKTSNWPLISTAFNWFNIVRKHTWVSKANCTFYTSSLPVKSWPRYANEAALNLFSSLLARPRKYTFKHNHTANPINIEGCFIDLKHHVKSPRSCITPSKFGINKWRFWGRFSRCQITFQISRKSREHLVFGYSENYELQIKFSKIIWLQVPCFINYNCNIHIYSIHDA